MTLAEEIRMHLLGGTVMDALEDRNDHMTGLRIKGRTGALYDVWVVRDPEGNGPGHLWITRAELSALPSLPGGPMQPKYPHITVALSGEDGNAFAILGRVERALRQAGVSAEERQAFQKEATSDDYDHLLQTAMRWVEAT